MNTDLWAVPVYSNLRTLVIDWIRSPGQIAEMVRKLNPMSLTFLNVKLCRHNIHLETAVLCTTRVEYFRLKLYYNVPRRPVQRANELRLSIIVLLHFFAISPRKITFTFNHLDLFNDRAHYNEFLEPVRDLANFYILDKPRHAFNVAWVRVFGGDRNLTIRDPAIVE